MDRFKHWKLSLVVTCLALIVALGFVLTIPQTAEAQTIENMTWVRFASQPRPNAEAQSVVLNGRLYSFGGFAPCCTPTRKSYYYDPKEDVWTSIADLPKGLTHAGATTDGTYVYIAGGYVERPGGGQIFGTQEAWRYNPATNSYSALPNMPAANSAGQLIYLNGKLHYIGGTTPGSRAADLDTHWVFTISTNTWTNAAPLPIPRQHAAALALDGKIYYIGGQKGHDGKLVPQNAVHRYDPATNQWTELSPMPGPGRNHISFSKIVINGKILILGGQTFNNTIVDNVTEYDPATNAWRELSVLPTPRASPIVGVIDNTIYLATGSSAAGYKAYYMPLPAKIENFTLIDTAEDYPIRVIREGDTLDLSKLPSGLSIGVTFSGWPVGSVVMGWNGNPRFRVENGAPFAYYDNSGTNFSSGPIPLGANTISATPYSGSNGGGTAGTPLTVNFNVINGTNNRAPNVTNPGPQTSGANEAIAPLTITASDPDGHTLTYSATGLPTGLSINATTGVISGTPTATGTFNSVVAVRDNGTPQLSTTVSFTWSVNNEALAATALTLINAATDQVISQIQPGATLNLRNLPPELNIGVTLTGSPIGSVVFGYDGNARFRVENIPVFSLFDNSGSNYLPGNLTVGTHTVTVTPYRGTNGGGTAGTALTVSFTVVDEGVNRPPVVTNPGSKSNVAGTAITPLQIQASDPDSDLLTYSTTGLPPGLSLNSTTGVISGTPSAAGSYSVALTVKDDGSPTAQTTVNFTWTITPAPTPLAVTQIVLIDAQTDQPIMQITNGMTLNLAQLPPQLNVDVITTGSTLGSIIYGFNGNARYRVESLPVYGMFNNSGSNYYAGEFALGSNTITATPYSGSNGSGTVGTARTVTFNVVNQPGATSARTATNEAPTITNPGNQISDVNTAITPLTITASDPEQGPLRYNAVGLPAGLSIDAASGLITGTPTASGTSSVTISVIDNGATALTASTTFTWSVNAAAALPNAAAMTASANHAPVLAPLSDLQSEVGAESMLVIVATDADGDTITYSALGLPAGLTLNPETGAVTGVSTTAGLSTVTITAADSGTPSLSSSASFTWTIGEASAKPVLNQPPTVASLLEQVNLEGDVIALQVAATDAEGSLTYSAVGLPTGLTIDPSTGLITGTIVSGSTAASPFDTTITITDGEGLTATSTFTWVVTEVP